jgi:hypothetical protein
VCEPVGALNYRMPGIGGNWNERVHLALRVISPESAEEAPGLRQSTSTESLSQPAPNNVDAFISPVSCRPGFKPSP